MQPIDFSKRVSAGWSGEYAIERFGYLIYGSKYGKGIFHLLDNPDLGKAVLREEINLKPNCWGTVAYLQGTEDLIKEQYIADGKRLDDFGSAAGDFIFFPGNSTPGYVGRLPFLSFLENNQDAVEVGGFTPDSIIGFYWENEYGDDFSGFGQRHAGICLGSENGNRIFFHQVKIGEDFGVEIVEEYKERKYSEFRDTMEERYFMFSEKQ